MSGLAEILIELASGGSGNMRDIKHELAFGAASLEPHAARSHQLGAALPLAEAAYGRTAESSLLLVREADER